MILLSRKSLLAIAAIVDIALHARSKPVSAKMLASRNNLAPRHLETILQVFVKSGILKGVRGPRGGYELGLERRNISIGDIIRAIMNNDDDNYPKESQNPPLVEFIISPLINQAGQSMLKNLDEINVDDLCKQAEANKAFQIKPEDADFII